MNKGEEMNMNAFPEQLRAIRKAKGLTQKKLADDCGLAAGTIQQYELGKRSPTAVNLHKIARALNVSYGFDEANEIILYDLTSSLNSNIQLEKERK